MVKEGRKKWKGGVEEAGYRKEREERRKKGRKEFKRLKK
jgi:hypothetical protein